jgi:hypothetical protein
MEVRFRLHPRILWIAAVSLALVLAGAAYAAIPSGSRNVISACYGKQGNHRVIKPDARTTCKRNESALSRNTEGRRGGLAHVFSVRKDQAVVAAGGQIEEVARLTLDRGKYLVFAKVNAFNRGGGRMEITCWLARSDPDGTPTAPGTAGNDSAETVLADPNISPFGYEAALPMTVTQEIDRRGPVIVYCRSSFNDFGAFINFIRITATSVGAITETELPNESP